MNKILLLVLGFILGYITAETLSTNTNTPKKYIYITKTKKDTIIKYRDKVRFKKVPVLVNKVSNSADDINKALSITIHDTLLLKDTMYLDTSFIDIYHRCERISLFRRREWFDVYTNKGVKSMEISRYSRSRLLSLSLQAGITYSLFFGKPIPYVGIGISYPLYTFKRCR